MASENKQNDIISNDPDIAISQILELADFKMDKDCYIYANCLCLEPINHHRATKGLFTTCNDNKFNIIKPNDKLNWTEKYGKSRSRFKYNTLGKPIKEIERIIKIAKLIQEINEI